MIKKGFTLIELLVVIAIIGILSVMILTNIQGVRARSRDLRRKSDLSSIQKSLRLYYNDARGFPASTAGFAIIGCGTIASPTTCNWGNTFSTTNSVYMQHLSLDPSSTATTNIYYQYYRSATDSDSYVLVTKLENLSDPDIADSQARCATIYSSFTGTKDATKDYLVCAE